MEASSSGHYICFNIKQYTSPLLGSADPKADLAKAFKTHQAAAALELEKQKLAISKSGKKKKTNGNTNRQERLAGGGNVFSKDKQLAVRGGTVHTPVSINLYMPPSVKVSYGAKYADQEIGAFSEVAAGAIGAFMKGGGGMEAAKDFFSSENLKKGGAKAVVAAGQVGLKAVKSAVEQMPGMAGAGAAASMSLGKIMAPRMELLFEGMGRRNFSFTFNFIPKSEEEAKTVEQIIFQFKYAMSSTFQIGQ
jgi:hypothetical protein